VIFYSARGLSISRPGWWRRLIGIALLGVTLTGCGGKSNFVTAIAINPGHPNVIFIATHDAVYKTRDDGATWITATEGLGNTRILSLAIHPINTSTIYAGTLGDAVYRSVDGGNRWSIINAGMKEHVSYVNAFVFHPKNPEIFLAATTVGIFETKNGGLMWEELSNKGMDSVYVVAAVIDPVETEVLYAGTSGGVYKTMNGGMNWVPINRGLIEGEFRTALALGINSLLMDPADRMTLYAGSTRGAFKTSDGGSTWMKIQEGMGERFVAAIVLHPAEPNVLYAGTQNGVYKTTDAGGRWEPWSNGLANLSIRSLMIHPKDPSILYAGTQGGLFKTVDGGANWTALTVRSKR
jgi:photosystem II stability/assembly factor-like uncharacterized protein